MVDKDSLPNGKLVDTLSQGNNSANRLMPRIEGSARLHIPLHHIRGTDATCLKLEQYLAWSDLWNRQINDPHIIVGIVFNSTHSDAFPYRLAGTIQRKPNGSAPSAKN